MYLSNEFMLDTLKKIQSYQAKVVGAGYSMHIDADTHRDVFDHSSTHISLDVTIYEDNTIIRQLDFYASMSEGEINTALLSLSIFVDSIS